MFARKESNGININGNGNIVFATTFIVSDAKAVETAADAVKEFFAPIASKQDGKQPEGNETADEGLWTYL